MMTRGRRKARVAVRALVLLLGAFSAGPPLGAQAGRPPGSGVLESVQVESSDERVDVWIRVRGFASHLLREFRGRPNQVVIDFKGVGSVHSAARVPVGRAGVTAVRTGQFEPATARVVVDLVADFPAYALTAMEGGFFLRLGKPPEPGPEGRTERPAEKAAADAPAKVEGKPGAAEETLPLVRLEEPTPVKRIEEPEAEAAEAVEPDPKLPVLAPEEISRILAEMNAERKRLKVRNFRAAAEAASFEPRRGTLREDFQGGMIAGALVAFRVGGSVDVWLAAGRYGKTASFGEGNRKARLAALAAGLDVRILRGTANPYAGFGLGTFVYSEQGAAEKLRAAKPGLAGRAGFFLRVGETLIIDVFGRYHLCSVKLGGREVDLGGFLFGVGLGGEF